MSLRLDGSLVLDEVVAPQRRRAHSVCSDDADAGAIEAGSGSGAGTDIENDAAEPGAEPGAEMCTSANETTIAMLMGRESATRTTATFKVGVFGVWASGKTSLQRRFIDKTFSPDIQATIGNGYSTTRVRVRGDTHDSVLQIWDTAGQERFADLAEHVMRGLHAALVVFSLAEPRTYDGCAAWISKLRAYDPLLPLVLVGAKCDLVSGSAPRHARCVERATAHEFARKHAGAQAGACEYVETSALLDVGVRDAFARVAELARDHARALARTRSIIDEAARAPLVRIVGSEPGGDTWPDEVRIDFDGGNTPPRRCCA